MKRFGFLRELLFFLLFLFLSVLNTWPLVRNLTSAVSDPGDPFLNAWIMEWDWWATAHQPLSLFHAPIFHPSRYALAFSEHLYGVAMFFFPFYAAGLGVITVYNLAMLAGFAFSGYGAFVLARMVTRSTIPAVAAGIFYAFVPFRFTHLPHIQHVWGGWLPILFAALIYYFRAPSWKRAALFGAAFLMNGLTNIHWFLFGSFAIFVSVFFLLLSEPKTRRRDFLLPLSTATVFALLVLMPFLLPYRSMSKMYRIERGPGEAQAYSARVEDWFIMSPPNKFYGNLPAFGRGSPERWLFPGILSLLLAASALMLARREDLPGEGRPDPTPERKSGSSRSWTQPWVINPRLLHGVDAAIVVCAILAYYDWAAEKQWPGFGAIAVALLVVRLLIRFPTVWGGREGVSLRTVLSRAGAAMRPHPDLWRFPMPVRLAILWIVLGFLCSRGMRTFFYEFLFDHIFAFRSIRVPARGAMLTYVGLSILIAVGVLPLLRKLRPRIAALAATGICLLFLLELRAAPIRWHLAIPAPPAVHEWIATAPFKGAVLELPMGIWNEAEYVLRATAHHRPLIDGVSGYFPELHQRILKMTESDPVDRELMDTLERIHCSLIIVHNEDLNSTPAIRTWLQEQLALQRLTILGRFEHGAGGDYAFGVVRNEPGAAQTMRQRDQPDVSGMTSTQKVEAFLSGRFHLFNNAAFGWLDSPNSSTDARGELRVSGWALSPYGISAVNLRFENGAVVVPADLWDWTDIKEAYPWYPKTSRPGFIRDFPERPPGISADTDLQVEIIDGAGNRTLLEQVMFRWLPRRAATIERWNEEALTRLIVRLGYDPAVERPRILEKEKTIEDLVRGWARSVESPDDTRFIILVFEMLLTRPPDEAGLDFYLQRLRRGESRKDMIDAIVRSSEFKQLYAR